MNLFDAIAQADGRWFRPVSYRGTGEAFGIADRSIIYFCNDFCNDFCEHYVPSELADLTGEWEFVSKGAVMGERELL